MNFSTADRVAQTIEDLKTAELRRAPNRTLIDELFNGWSPYTDQEAQENHIQVNVNWGEGSDLLLQARQQYENAFLTTGYYFTIKVPDAPVSKRNDYSSVLTSEANKVLKKSLPYIQTQREKWGSVVLHGTGAQMWEDDQKPIPYFVRVPDLLIPTDTEITLDDLPYFAVRQRMKVGQLYRKTFGKGENVDPGWQLDKVRKILDSYRDFHNNPNNYNWADQPEQMAKLYKQNLLYYESDSAPSVWMWSFYFQKDDSAKPDWDKVVILDNDCVPGKISDTANPISWIYKTNRPFAANLSEILHVQFGDGNNVPPFTYHESRGLGQRLFDVVHMMNRLRCQFTQKVFEDMMMLFHVNDPADKGRLDKIFLGMQYGVIPDGLSFVRKEERYSPDANMVEMLMANYKQLMGESTQGYTQDIDSGTKKERTAFEVNALLNQTTKLTSSMLNLAYLQEGFAYEEICRRLALPDTHDFNAKKFQAACKEADIPKKWMDPARWQIEPERVMGSGNQQIEMAQAQALMAIRPILNPEGQQRLTSKYVFAVTHDSKVVQELAPYDSAPHVSDTMHDTQIVFGTLMSANWVEPKPGLNPQEVVETMLSLMEAKVKHVMMTGGVGTGDDVTGLSFCEKYTAAFIQMMALDQSQKSNAQVYGKRLGKVMNEVKAMAQRQQQAAAKQNGQSKIDPETIAKIQGDVAMMQQKLKSKEMTAQQSLRHKEIKFQADQRRQNMKALGDISMDAAKTAATVRSQEAYNRVKSQSKE